ncbi:DUF4233 domain-containing protein [Arsenicicoccus cauae]|uniref:DUF4233 domain-containing protein n=1 Tax=Arsenicicoccus cauae TaxID=2663847 RepID=A0A6I3ISI8_9MICO|nr:DUF4233 domain-containing protein [Arsenicicoccus cauae]MTB71231.1 DUF4233 domain-containing protein [Arsenicicoccus cauae]
MLHGVPRALTRRLLAAVIASESVVVFFGALVAMSLDRTEGGSGTTWLVLGSILAVLCVVDAGMLRRPWGVTLGWFLHLATLVSALVVPMMFWVFVIFCGLWVVALVQGHKIDDLADEARRRHDAESSTGPSAT